MITSLIKGNKNESVGEMKRVTQSLHQVITLLDILNSYGIQVADNLTPTMYKVENGDVNKVVVTYYSSSKDLLTSLIAATIDSPLTINIDSFLINLNEFIEKNDLGYDVSKFLGTFNDFTITNLDEKIKDKSKEIKELAKIIDSVMPLKVRETYNGKIEDDNKITIIGLFAKNVTVISPEYFGLEPIISLDSPELCRGLFNVYSSDSDKNVLLNKNLDKFIMNYETTAKGDFAENGLLLTYPKDSLVYSMAFLDCLFEKIRRIVDNDKEE